MSSIATGAVGVTSTATSTASSAPSTTGLTTQSSTITATTTSSTTQVTTPPGPTTTGTTTSPTTPAPTATGVTESPTTPGPTTTGVTESPTTPGPTTTGTTESPTTPGPTTTGVTESPTTPGPTTTGTTESPTTPGPTTTGVTESPITPAPTTTGVTESPTTPGPTTTGVTESPTTTEPTTSSANESPTTPEPTTTGATESLTTPGPTTIVTTETPTTPEPTTTGVTESPTTPEPTTTGVTESLTTPEPTTIVTTETPTTPEPTTTGVTESLTTPGSTTTGVTESPTTPGPTTSSMTETTTTTQTNIPLSFSTVGNFDSSLNNRSSRRFQSLARNIIGGLNRVYRADRNYRGAMVNNFRNGSIIANCTLTYNTTPTTPSASTVVRQLLNNLENGTNLGNVTLFPSTIRSDGTTVNNLEPISLNISFVIEDEVFNTNLNDMDSAPFRTLRSRVINWLDPVLTSVFGPSTMSNYSVSFSNASTMVQVFTNVQINTTNFANQTMLRDLYIENISASGFDIVISSIQVDGVSLETNRFPLQFRFTNLNFTADLNMRGSPMFRALSANVTNVVSGIFRNNSGFVDIVVNGFASGSVLCDTTISVQPNSISQAAVTQMLANNADAFNNANLRLDVNALTNTTTTVAPTTTTVTMTTTPATTIPTVNQPEPPRPFPGFAVAIIVMCSLALLTLPFVIVLCVKSGYCSKMANAFRLESPDNLDLRLPMFGGRSYNFN